MVLKSNCCCLVALSLSLFGAIIVLAKSSSHGGTEEFEMGYAGEYSEASFGEEEHKPNVAFATQRIWGLLAGAILPAVAQWAAGKFRVANDVGGDWCPIDSVTHSKGEELEERRRRDIEETDEGNIEMTATLENNVEAAENVTDIRAGSMQRGRRCTHHAQCYRYGKVCCPAGGSRRRFTCRAPRLQMQSTSKGVLVTTSKTQRRGCIFICWK